MNGTKSRSKIRTKILFFGFVIIDQELIQIIPFFKAL